jgi:hypothetical protein
MVENKLSPVDISLEGIGHVLRDRRLEVPPYQRGYSWGQDEVADFWWDLKASYVSSVPQYFLGTIVLAQAGGSGRSTIIDGQQRLTTASLLLLGIRNEFFRRRDLSRGEVIERDYAIAVDLKSGKTGPRLLLNPDDFVHYEAVINSHGLGAAYATDSSTQSRIAKAMVFLDERVKQEAKEAGPNWSDTLFRWVDFVEHQVRVITVTVPSEADAFLIFETLNARGRALTVADLLKNYLFSLAGDDLEVAQANWVSALLALEATADEEIFTTYVRHLWGSFHGATRERELYGRLKAAITSKPAALEFSQEIGKNAPLYSAILNTDQPWWTQRRDLIPAGETLLRLGLEQYRPLLLSAMRRFDDHQIALLLRGLIAWSTRGLIVGGIGGGSTERAYGEAAVSVSEGRATNAQSVFKELSHVIPTDEAFHQAFAVRRINRTAFAKYLLVALAQAERSITDAQIVSSSEETKFELRTIIPRNATPHDWPDFVPNEVSQWSSRLGNLYITLVDNGNPAPMYQFLEREHPTPNSISRRQQALADLAVAVWPRELW